MGSSRVRCVRRRRHSAISIRQSGDRSTLRPCGLDHCLCLQHKCQLLHTNTRRRRHHCTNWLPTPTATFAWHKQSFCRPYASISRLLFVSSKRRCHLCRCAQETCPQLYGCSLMVLQKVQELRDWHGLRAQRCCCQSTALMEPGRLSVASLKCWQNPRLPCGLPSSSYHALCMHANGRTPLWLLQPPPIW